MIRKFFSTAYNEYALSVGLLLLRMTAGTSMAFYGYDKLGHFADQAHSDFWEKQVNFLGHGGPFSLSLTIFAEFFCSLFLILGLFTRLSLVPLLFCMGYIVAILDHYELVSAGEHGYELNHAFNYFVIYFFLFLSGPGKWSIDKLISK